VLSIVIPSVLLSALAGWLVIATTSDERENLLGLWRQFSPCFAKHHDMLARMQTTTHQATLDRDVRSLRALSGHFRRSGQIVGGIASRCYQQSGENIRLWRCGGLFLRPLGIASRCYQQQGETVSRQLSIQELDIVVLAHLKTHDHSFVAKCSGSNCLSGYLRA
jgi:hypothetical protein